MYTLSCKDLDPAGECEFSATGETKEEVTQKMMEHAGMAHKDKMDSMTDEDKKMMGDKINQVLSAQG